MKKKIITMALAMTLVGAQLGLVGEAFAGAQLDGSQGSVTLMYPHAHYTFPVSPDGSTITRPADGMVFTWNPQFEKYCVQVSTWTVICFEFSDNSSLVNWGRVHTQNGTFYNPAPGDYKQP